VTIQALQVEVLVAEHQNFWLITNNQEVKAFSEFDYINLMITNELNFAFENNSKVEIHMYKNDKYFSLAEKTLDCFYETFHSKMGESFETYLKNRV